ncbi:MAG: hypothetical protein SRB2_01235 [Desulfobacteraceae bacterium Eth-SRB2]|nr:MAG: hypothetical protein SRB2_01235 [Desulfobacteraceae bacterium Eth-SRB2]
MEQLDQIVNTISLAMGAAWASGINLYAAILVLGLLGITENIVLPANLQLLMNPLVIGAAGVMYIVEFIVDKMPGVDTGWDTFHTFIRIPAGVLMAAGAVGDVNPSLALTAGILGGGLAAGAHATKSGSRIIINTSPEPLTNWTASVVEDILVIGGLWTALHYPWLFIALMIVFILLMIWVLPKLWRGIKKVFGFIGGLFGYGKTDKPSQYGRPDNTVCGANSAHDRDESEKKIEKLNGRF